MRKADQVSRVFWIGAFASLILGFLAGAAFGNDHYGWGDDADDAPVPEVFVLPRKLENGLVLPNQWVLRYNNRETYSGSTVEVQGQEVLLEDGTPLAIFWKIERTPNAPCAQESAARIGVEFTDDPSVCADRIEVRPPAGYIAIPSGEIRVDERTTLDILIVPDLMG